MSYVYHSFAVLCELISVCDGDFYSLHFDKCVGGIFCSLYLVSSFSVLLVRFYDN